MNESEIHEFYNHYSFKHYRVMEHRWYHEGDDNTLSLVQPTPDELKDALEIWYRFNGQYYINIFI